MNSILLALQFFTSLPVKKELPLGKKEVSGMYMALPLIGGGIGMLLAGTAYIVSDLNSFLAAMLILLAGLIATGGLHADGFADLGDAFFSYQDREKRLTIMEDPRLGAFGTLSLLLLLGLKIGLFIEIIALAHGWALLIAVPILSRSAMILYFTTTETAKQSGLAHFFKQHFLLGRMQLAAVFISLIIIIALVVLYHSFAIVFVLPITIALAVWLYRRWTVKHFGGVTGDLCGAFIEGMEVLLWLVLIVCLSSAI
ncbi:MULTISPECIES: adenosylcobinamide-GDP ribazoletransferase [unclassified Sporosarcina]|uniref:adenosylcobinamide-GDP ribazoletransferase n=1 Tax=unclassified Sporosarcina TaxID=2647733 RepID=UPI00203F7272|nr:MULTISPECIES: adenosylcobinamide-GDP ribazoletransferase [unclassified Sporosarcina]GKV66841.1 adenosylcobinamide-GDP ribazoletransferase [Sporosarcina sp. NCCP-2331]GLB57250.1 adenosylcobinamide-GDP ribazoletransferase [Sporosarcina sp. NCCP-2378]